MIKVLSSGFYTTIQDLGRFGYRDLGVPISGVMDKYSATIANQLLGNNENEAVLEITLGKCKLLVENNTNICVSGADLYATLNDDILKLNTVIEVRRGDIISFDKSNYGVRSYLAVKGGFQTNTILNSRSFYKSITFKHVIIKDDILPIEAFNFKINPSFSTLKIDHEHFDSKFIETYEGPEYELLNNDQKEKLLQTTFTISKDNNRMGYRLEELINNKITSMLTSAVLPGTVQLTPSGKLIVLMRDCQVTGGYPRILQLTDNAINKLAQKTTGDSFKFKIVPLS